MPELMSMFMGMGMSLEEVVTSVTRNGAAAIGLRDEIGTLAPGAVGDAAVLDFEPGEFKYHDAQGGSVHVPQRIKPVATVKDGKLWRPSPSSSLMGEDRGEGEGVFCRRSAKTGIHRGVPQALPLLSLDGRGLR